MPPKEKRTYTFDVDLELDARVNAALQAEGISRTEWLIKKVEHGLECDKQSVPKLRPIWLTSPFTCIGKCKKEIKASVEEPQPAIWFMGRGGGFACYDCFAGGIQDRTRVSRQVKRQEDERDRKACLDELDRLTGAIRIGKGTEGTRELARRYLVELVPLLSRAINATGGPLEKDAWDELKRKSDELFQLAEKYDDAWQYVDTEKLLREKKRQKEAQQQIEV